MNSMAMAKPRLDLEAPTEIKTYKYDSHVKPRLEEIYTWVKDGYTDYSIADNLGICHESLIKYKSEILELSSIYIRARAERNTLVMNSMFKKASGEKVSINKVKVLNNGDYVEYKEEQYIPPDVNAADLYLRNNSDDYKSAKADVGGLTLIQNNYQLPQLQAELMKIDEELKRLEIIDTTATEIE